MMKMGWDGVQRSSTTSRQLIFLRNGGLKQKEVKADKRFL